MKVIMVFGYVCIALGLYFGMEREATIQKDTESRVEFALAALFWPVPVGLWFGEQCQKMRMRNIEYRKQDKARSSSPCGAS